MTTLAEQLHQLALCEHKTLELKNAIKKFVSQERIFDMLKKALANKFTAKISYPHFDNEGFVELKPIETSQFSGYNAYRFVIQVEPRKIALESRIVFDGKNASIQIIEYQTHLLAQNTVIELLKQVIGVENKVK